MVDVVDSIIAEYRRRPALDEQDRSAFAVHCEIQDASENDVDINAAPLSASLHIARLLTRFETQIDDEWRAQLIQLGGDLVRLDRTLGLTGD